MINKTLYAREMKKSIKLWVIIATVITMYVTIIIGMYDPKMMTMLDSFYDAMPELMAAVGMKAGATSLLGFMSSYLYGFILLIFPMIYSIVRGNGLVAGYVDNGSMAVLLSAPVKRRSIIMTQMAALVSGVFLLIAYITGLEWIVAGIQFQGELRILELLKVNAALLFLQLFIAAICFLASCVFSDTKYSIAMGAGLPILMYVLQMLANVGEKTEKIKYITFFTLFDADGLAAGDGMALVKSIVLLVGAIAMFTAGTVTFCKKDLSL